MSHGSFIPSSSRAPHAMHLLPSRWDLWCRILYRLDAHATTEVPPTKHPFCGAGMFS